MLGLSRALLAAASSPQYANCRTQPLSSCCPVCTATGWRAAQLELLARLRAGQVRINSPFGVVTVPEHPALWAGFVLIGER